jgi:hypothetical protein
MEGPLVAFLIIMIGMLGFLALVIIEENENFADKTCDEILFDIQVRDNPPKNDYAVSAWIEKECWK